MTMFCTECTYQFFYDSVKLGVVIISFIIAMLSLVILRKSKNSSSRQKIILMFVHIFALVFPFVFYATFKGCETMFASCNTGWQIITILSITLGISIILGLVFSPVLFIIQTRRKSIQAKGDEQTKIINSICLAEQIEVPDTFYIMEAKPRAFAFTYRKPTIFLSIGLLDILNPKEIEAIVLHELYHIKSRASVFKSVILIFRLASPFSSFVTFDGDLTKEERDADAFAVSFQQTSEHVRSAKNIINAFHCEKID